jgi:hypothetical protein
MSPKPFVMLAGLVAGAALIAAPGAFADQVFHTSHAAVHAVAGAPLQSGFVNDIHSNGVVNSAREEYHLNGAQPNTTYQVQLLFYEDPSCAGSPLSFTTAVLTTNGAGNGNADVTFSAGPPNSPPLQVGIVWQFSANGTAVYTTDCVQVSID